MTHTGLGELLDLWAVALLVGLVVGAGLSPALKGSRAGLDWWIDRVDLAASVMGQFAAMATWLLTIQLVMAGFRAGSQRRLLTALAVLGVWPVVTLMGAQRAALPPNLWLGAIGMTAASCLLSGSANRRARPGVSLVLLCAGVSLSLELGSIISSSWLEHAPEALPRLRSALGLTAGAAALFLQLRQSARGHVILPAAVTFSGMLFLTIVRAGQPEAPTWILLVGRTLQSMTPDPHWARGAWTPSFQLCVSMMAVGWTVAERLWRRQAQAPAALLAAVSALALAVPISPLSIATLTLLGIAALPLAVPPGTPQRPVPRAGQRT